MVSTVATVATVATASTLLMVTSATPALADTPPGPDRTELLSEYNDWWTPSEYDDSSEESTLDTAFKGDVTAEGAEVLGHNDDFIESINQAGAADPDQSLRALEDADEIWTETLGDSLGPVLSSYLTEGVEKDELPKTSSAMESAEDAVSTGDAKTDFNFPRPFLQTDEKDKGGVGDRSRNGDNDLKGLDAELDIDRVKDQGTRPDDGEPHSANYDGMAGIGDEGLEDLNQAFPSGHTTFAYGVSLQLAEMLPELAPQIITRGSEAGNNRIVLGVHYPLDVIGGRISGHVNTATQYADGSYIEDTLEPAREELVGYLEDRCEADGHGDTLADCIEDTDANDAGGYTNDFTDEVSTEPVTDRASALDAYESRMTYGFDKTSEGSETSGESTVPENAEKLLVTAFPELNDTQRRSILAETQIEAGYPLDKTSQGWQRINLPAALSAKVTLDSTGDVAAVEPGQDAPSVVDGDVPGDAPGSVPESSSGSL